jgi:hypothetical protein
MFLLRKAKCRTNPKAGQGKTPLTVTPGCSTSRNISTFFSAACRALDSRLSMYFAPSATPPRSVRMSGKLRGELQGFRIVSLRVVYDL